jgi:ABC-2 type transport system permease protein
VIPAFANLKIRFSIYAAFGVTVAKRALAYNSWVYAQVFVQAITMLVMVYFWSAIYENRATVGGQTLVQTLNYILITRLIAGFGETDLIHTFDRLIGRGDFVIELLRPVDFQSNQLVEVASSWLTQMVLRWPLLPLALLFGLQLPQNPAIYLAFLLSMILGALIIFFFDFLLACLNFITLEGWGLSVMRGGLASFLSGALIPLTLMPDWLRTICEFVPFSQAIFVPAALLSGTLPLERLPATLGIQLLWLVGLFFLSRWVFARSIRKITIQGG